MLRPGFDEERLCPPRADLLGGTLLNEQRWEGFARRTDKDFAHFLDVAKGSAVEVQSLLYAALDIGYIKPEEFERLHGLAEETVLLIGGFASYLRRAQER